MKDIITGTSMTETKDKARQLWHEYNKAVKLHKELVYQDLKKIYFQVYKGNKVIDIGKVIAKGGVHENFHPRLAIAKATNKKVWCRYDENGDVQFTNQQSGWKTFACDVILHKCLPAIPKEKLPTVGQWRDSRFQLTAPVPLIPAKLRPTKLTDDYYILWEVDVWQMIPPTDPYLLRRITKNMFVVVAGWDLTDIEKSAMAGRMY